MSSDQTNGHEATSVDDDVDQVRQSLTAHDAGGLSSDHFKPFAFAVFLVRRPKTTIALIWTVILLVNFIVLGTGMMQLTDNSDRDFAIKDHITSKRRWAYERAEEFVSLGEGDGVLQETQTIEEDDWRVQVMYEAGSGMATVATKANFDTMYRAEKFLREMPKYDEFCLWDAKTNACAAGAYVSFLDKIGYDPDTWTQGMIDTEIANAAAIIDTDDGVDVRPFFGIEFGPSNTNSKWMRSIFSFGGPLRGYRNVRDDDKGQKKDFQNFFERFDDKVRVDSAYDSKNMRVLYLGQAAFDALFEKLVQGDLLWAIGSMVFVWVYMTFHLKSFFLASVTMLQIILSFPLGFFIYHVFMGIEMFQSIHALAIFLMLGIAADNSFVIADCFIQGAAYDVLVDNLELRMSYVFRRAAKAIFITNFSTLTAFLATSVSALIPIATFGLWAAALILCNWFLSVTNFPCCLMLWHLYLRKCGTCSNKVQDEEEQDGVSAGDRPAAKEDVELDKIESAAAAPASNGTANAPLASKSSSTAALEPNANGEAVVHSRTTRQSTRVGMESGELRLIERFFLFKWSPFLSKWRYVILGVLVAWFISATVIASRLEPLSEQERFFPSDHFISRAQDASEDAFFRTKFDFSVRVKLVWGVKGIDMSGTNRFDPDDIGTVKWDSTFDLSDPEAQQHIYDVCQELIQNCTVGCSDAPATDSLVVQGDGTVTCFMNDFRTWARARGDGFPLNYTRIANSQTVPLATRKELFRERIVVFLNETNFFNATDYETDYSVGLDPSQNLRFVSVEAVSPLQPFEPHSITHPVYEDWEAFIDRVNARAPSTANKGFETGGVYWAWMIAEKELVSGTFKGLAIAASVAFAVLVIATLNWVMALYSIFLVFTVVASVTAVIVLQGWSLGASEAIAIVLVTGLSIDYVAHIAVAYVESSAKKRIQRTIEALTHLGISVIGGAVTSGGSASFLYGAIVIFFLKFATIITSTVGFALLAAVVFFPVVLMVGGPERDVGSLVAYYRAARAKMIEKGWIEAPTKQ